MKEIIRELRRIEAFRNLQEHDLEPLATACKFDSFPMRQVIGKEGENADRLFVLLRGVVGIWIDYGEENADLLAEREAPCLVGELSVADQLPRSATIVTQTPVEVYILGAAAFRTLLEEHGSLSLALLITFSNLIRTSNDSFVKELREQNKELEAANRKLKTMQRLLVHQERLSNLGKFSSIILHDLKNPLSVIKSYASLLDLQLGENDSSMVKYARQIRQEVERLEGLAVELLDYSRGEIRLAYGPITVEELMNKLRDNMKIRLEAKEIRIEWDLNYKEGTFLDVERMLRVLINLTDNARNASVRGGVLRIGSKAEGGRLILYVTDHGVGMDGETLSHIFEPFYSASLGTGTGLGLYIVKTVVEAHGGTVHVKSTINEGTSVTLNLPLRF